MRDGKFLKALLHEELKQEENWIAKIRALPETPETYYLLELMASDDFQESLKNYLDLDDLSKRLASWDVNNLKAISVSQNHQAYDAQIRQLKNRAYDAKQKVEALMARQGQILEMMAINELNRRRKHLQDYQAHARFALADSYERASRTQTPK